MQNLLYGWIFRFCDDLFAFSALNLSINVENEGVVLTLVTGVYFFHIENLYSTFNVRESLCSSITATFMDI